MRALLVRWSASAVLSVLLAVVIGGCGDGGQVINPPVDNDQQLLVGTGSANGYVYTPVRVRASDLVVCELPLTEAEQEAQGLEPLAGGIATMDTGQKCRTGRSGTYSLVGVPAGSRVISFADRTGASLGSGVPVNVRTNGTTSGTRDPALTSTDPGACFGYLLGRPRMGSPIGGAAGLTWTDVRFAPSDLSGGLGELLPIPNVQVTLDGQATTTDEDGFFLFANVAPGEYQVTALEHHVPVEILGGQTVSVGETPAGPTGAVAGYVAAPVTLAWGDLYFSPTDPSGLQTVTDAWVMIDSGQMVRTNALGQFGLMGVTPGLHIVAAARETDEGFENLAVGQAFVVAGQVARVGVFPANIVGDIAITAPSTDTIQVGDMLELDAGALTPQGDLIFDFDWSSDNPQVARVNDFGVVRGKSAGSAVITATCGSKSASTTIHVVGATTQGRSLLYTDGLELWSLTRGSAPTQLSSFQANPAWGITGVLSADVSPDGTIIFQGEAGDSGQYDLFEFDAATAAPANLTQTPDDDEWAPRFSHDGQYLVFTSMSWGSSSGAAEAIVLADLSTYDTYAYGQPGWTPSFGAAFSPDDSVLAVGVVVHNDTAAAGLPRARGLNMLRGLRPRQATGESYGIGLISVSTSDVVGFFDTGQILPTTVDWLDSQTVVFTGAANGGTDVYWLDVSTPGSAPCALTNDGLDKYFVAAGPGGQAVAYSVLSSNLTTGEFDADIVAVRIDDGHVVPLATTGTVEFAPRWYPD
ncbi:MAG TPA: Ig-like domain-containing protein [Armatimonadota bacterium]|nr:Ig-like domain-containing protein [Armatimonadota bacterium]